MRAAGVGGIAGVVLLLGATGFGIATPSPALAASTGLTNFNAHVSHIVFLMQENHAFDSLYGTYCPATGKYCASTANGIPAGTCLPKTLANPSKGCIAPYNFSAAELSPVYDLPHNWVSTHKAWNNGSMNGFVPAEMSKNETVGHYNGTTAPVYWDVAEEYGLADDFFSSAATYSLANHWYEVAAQSPNIAYKTLLGINQTNWTDHSTYLNQSNATPTLADELVNSSVSWAFFDNTLGSYAQAIRPVPYAPAYSYWSPLQARSQSYVPSTATHFQNRSAFFSDAANGTLPDVSWIIPAAQNSDHPPYNLTAGQDWIADVVNALELSPEWNSTVLFVTWDEYGGFYDHVAPPRIDAWGDGFRVPLLAIGPYVRQGVIDHQAMNFDSILHLIELRFGLACLGARDCGATLPLGMFNFAHAPRHPIQIPLYGRAVYPMPLQSSGKLPYYGTNRGGPTVAYVDPPPSAVPGDASIDWS